MKITGNAETYRNMSGDIDFNAGRLLTGERSLDQLGEELLALTIDVARGAQTKPELLGHREYFVMYKHQDTPPLEIGCRA
jgi:altronate hydrolase